MVAYDYTIAKNAISEGEKDRILAVFLNTDNGVVNWEKATKDFGATSVDSMKVSVRNIYKKIDKAGGKIADDGSISTAPVAAPATPASGKKRKSKGEITADGDDEDATVETPKPKKKGGRPKKVISPKVVENDTMDEDDGETVKKEATDEFA